MHLFSFTYYNLFSKISKLAGEEAIVLLKNSVGAWYYFISYFASK